MSVINTGNHPKHLWPGVFAFFGQTYEQHGEEWRDLVDVVTSDKNYEEMVQNNGFGLAPIKEQGASIAYDTDSQGGTARATHITYGLGYIVTREEIEDNQYEKVAMDRAQALKISMIETKENVVANFLNRGFDSNYTGGADAKELFSASHTTSAGNQSNILATAADLSEAALEDMIIQIMGAQNDRGLKIKLMPQTLHVPRQLVYEATRILKSINQNDSANNAINALRAMNALPGGVKVNHYFTDPDAWFIKTNVVKGLTLFQRRALEFTKDNDFGTENALAKATERYSVQWGDWRTYFGSAGA
jgi:hypothetical protein